jgi:hypothetical protein
VMVVLYCDHKENGCKRKRSALIVKLRFITGISPFYTMGGMFSPVFIAADEE